MLSDEDRRLLEDEMRADILAGRVGAAQTKARLLAAAGQLPSSITAQVVADSDLTTEISPLPTAPQAGSTPPSEEPPPVVPRPPPLPKERSVIAQFLIVLFQVSVVVAAGLEALVLLRDAVAAQRVSWAVVGILLVFVALLLTNLGGFRSRLPVFGSDNSGAVVLGWGGLLIGIVLVLAWASPAAGDARSGGSPVSQSPIGPSRAQAELIDPRRLVADPNSFRGKNMVLQGKALNVNQHSDYTWVQLMAQPPGRDTTDSVVVEVRPKNTQLLKDECYRVYAVGAGTQSVTRLITGASSDAPLVNAYAIDSAPARNYGCAPP